MLGPGPSWALDSLPRSAVFRGREATVPRARIDLRGLFAEPGED